MILLPSGLTQMKRPSVPGAPEVAIRRCRRARRRRTWIQNAAERRLTDARASTAREDLHLKAQEARNSEGEGGRGPESSLIGHQQWKMESERDYRVTTLLVDWIL